MLLNLLFPKRCLDCNQTGRYICKKCQKKLFIQDKEICPFCGRLSIGGITHKHCPARFNLNGLAVVWQYKGLAKELVRKIKYRFIYSIVEEAVQLVCRDLFFRKKLYEFEEFLGKKPVVIPIPLHKQRLNWRGFNQAEKLGRELAKNWRLPFSSKILERIKPTKPQVELKGKKRQENIKGAFDLSFFLSSCAKFPSSSCAKFPSSSRAKSRDLKPLKARNFLLVDDVWTTGSTMRECAKVLKKGGAGEVWGLALAR